MRNTLTGTTNDDWETPTGREVPEDETGDSRAATDLEDSRSETPGQELGSGSEERVLNKNPDLYYDEPPLAPAGIPLFSRRSPRLNAESKEITPQKAPRGPRTFPSAPPRRVAAPLKCAPNMEKFLADNSAKRLTRKLTSVPGLQRATTIATGRPPRSPSRRGEPLAKAPAPVRAAHTQWVNDPPHEGMPFGGMVQDNDEQKPLLNALSNTYFQESYCVRDLPEEFLNDFMQTDCASGQIEARRAEEGKAPTTDVLEAQAEGGLQFCKDVQNQSVSGQTYYTNNSHRQCMQVKCGYLSHVRLVHHDGKPSLLQFAFCSAFCQNSYAHDCMQKAKAAGAGQRFLWPVATHEHRMDARSWLNHRRKYNLQQRDRISIATAFQAYEKIYGKKSAAEVVALAGGNPVNYAKVPKWPSYAERTKVGPLLEDESANVASALERLDAINAEAGTAAEDMHAEAGTAAEEMQTSEPSSSEPATSQDIPHMDIEEPTAATQATASAAAYIASSAMPALPGNPAEIASENSVSTTMTESNDSTVIIPEGQNFPLKTNTRNPAVSCLAKPNLPAEKQGELFSMTEEKSRGETKKTHTVHLDPDENTGFKDYRASLHEKSAKSKAKKKGFVSSTNFPKAKANSTKHPNLRAAKYSHQDMERRVNESREGTQDHPLEQISEVRDHYVSGDRRLFFLCKSKNDRIGKYLSLRTAYETNPELLLPYIHKKKLQGHQECKAYGVDFQLKCFLNNLSYESKISTLEKSPSQRQQYLENTERNHSAPCRDGESSSVHARLRVDTPAAALQKQPTDAVEAGRPVQLQPQGSMWSKLQQMKPEEVAKFCEGRPQFPPMAGRAPVAEPQNGAGRRKYDEAFAALSTRGRRTVQGFPAKSQRDVSDNSSDDDTHGAITEEMYAQQKLNAKRKPKLQMRAPSGGCKTRLVSTALREKEGEARWAEKKTGHVSSDEYESGSDGDHDGNSDMAPAHVRVLTKANQEANVQPMIGESNAGARQSSQSDRRNKGKPKSNHHDRHESRRASDSDDDEDKPKRYVNMYGDDPKDGDITSDTSDYDSPRDYLTERVVDPGEAVNPKETTTSTDSDGTLSDSESDSDDSSSDSDLEIRRSQRKRYKRREALVAGGASRKIRRNRSSRSASPDGRHSKVRSRSLSPGATAKSQSREETSRKQSANNNDDPPWREEFAKWKQSAPKLRRRREESRKNKSSKRPKKSRDTRNESLSALGAVERVHLGVLVTELIESSDGSMSEDDFDEDPSEVVLAASSSVSADNENPPQEFFDDLLQRPEHIARIQESGLDRAVYLAKVLKAPSKVIGELYFDLSKKKHIDREREKIPRSLQYPERLTANAQFRPGNGSIDTLVWRKNFMSECTWVREKYLTPLCLRTALDPKVSAAVRSNFTREKYKGRYEAEKSDLIPFDEICRFLKKTYDRPGRLEHALLDYLTLSQGKGTVRDLITTRTNKLGILSRLGAEPLPEDLDRALILRALSAPLSEYIASRHNHLKYSVDEILRICKTRELAVNNASRSSRNESLNTMSRRGDKKFTKRRAPRNTSNRFQNKGHLNAAVFKRKPRVTSRRPNKANLFAFGNDNEQPRISTRLFRTNYSDAEWNVRVGPDGKIKSGVNPKDPRHRNSFNKDTVQGKPWCLICKRSGHDMTSCRTPKQSGQGKGKGKGGNRNGGRGQGGRGQNKFRR